MGCRGWEINDRIRVKCWYSECRGNLKKPRPFLFSPPDRKTFLSPCPFPSPNNLHVSHLSLSWAFIADLDIGNFKATDLSFCYFCKVKFSLLNCISSFYHPSASRIWKAEIPRGNQNDGLGFVYGSFEESLPWISLLYQKGHGRASDTLLSLRRV